MICERVYQVDVRKLAKLGINPSPAFNSCTGKLETVETEFTPCNLGGERIWFKCSRCERRCAILYAAPHFACRTCHGLRYAIEGKSIYDRAIRKAIRFRQRYGLKEGGIVAPFPKKPYLMRWHTYLKAKKRDEELVQKIYGWTASRLPMF